jgi:hypothetical protein
MQRQKPPFTWLLTNVNIVFSVLGSFVSGKREHG